MHRGDGKGVKGKQPQQQKRREEPPSLEGDESPNPLLGEQEYGPYTDGVSPGVVTSVMGGAGGRVWVEHPGEKEIFRVERHVLYASHAAAVTHWEQQKVAAAGKKAAEAKRKPNPKRDADPPAEPAPSWLSLNPSLRLRRPLGPSPKLPLRPHPWRWMPQRTPRPNRQPNHLPKPMTRPGWGRNPGHGPPFGGPDRPRP